MEVHVEPPSIENSQFKMLPLCPLSVTVPLLDPVQTVVLPDTPPPADTATTVMVAADEFTVEQVPFLITARYMVVVVMFR
jgi:hypothetical protein